MQTEEKFVESSPSRLQVKIDRLEVDVNELGHGKVLIDGVAVPVARLQIDINPRGRKATAVAIDLS